MDHNEHQQQQEEKPHATFFNGDIAHARQQSTYDCGVACLKMCLDYVDKTKGYSSNGIIEDILKNKLKVENSSLWTIDIAHVCALLNTPHVMYTIKMGVDDSYSKEDFYSKEKNFDDEKERINLKFNIHKELGINVQKKELSFDFIKSEIRREDIKVACIVLVDARKLNGTNTEETDYMRVHLVEDDAEYDEDEVAAAAMRAHSTASCCLYYPFSVMTTAAATASSPSDFYKKATTPCAHDDKKPHHYCGHFVVLVGFDDNRRLIFYRNPSSRKSLSYTTYDKFEAARVTYGTDQDILFIYDGTP